MKRCTTCGSEFADDAVYCQWDGAPLAQESAEVDPYIGQVLKDQIEILAPLGQGGMGTVYRAVQRGFDRTIAVKILHADLARNPEVLARFHREAKIASRLEHPNIVHVYLFGELPDGNLFLAMEFLDGRSLLEVLRRDGAIEVVRALHIAQQICAALAEAHEAGIVHRDLKPENIMLVRRGTDPDFVKILDFGIAKFVAAEAQQGDVHTQQGLVFGTARYISPEGASGDPVDARSDVYSLGVVLYQMMSGEVPFHSENPISLLLMHINDPPPPLRGKPRAAGVPPAVADVVMRALAKRPGDRYGNAREFGQALADAAAKSSLMMPGRASASPRRVVESPTVGVRPGSLAPPSVAPAPPAAGGLPPMIRTLEGPALSPDDVKEPAFVMTREAPRPMPATRLQAAVSPEELEARAASMLAASTHAGGIAPVRPSRADPLASTDPAGSPVGSISMDAVRLPSSRAPLIIALVVILLLGAAAAAVAYVRTHGTDAGGGGAGESLVAPAEAAFAAGRLTSPAGDGAVELLERAIAATPTEPTVVDLKNRVVARLESDADQARREGRLADARQSLQLLLRLDPAHPRARTSLQGIEAALAQSGTTGTGPTPDLHPVSGPPVPSTPAAVVSVAETAFAGRAVHLTARVTGVPSGAAFSQPRFLLARRAPGETPTELPATTGGDAGTFLAEFAFPRAGTWDVTFTLATSTGTSIEGRLALAVHVPAPGGPFTTGGGSAEVDPPDGGTGVTSPPPPGPDGGTGTITPPIKQHRRRPPPSPDGGSGGRWM